VRARAVSDMSGDVLVCLASVARGASATRGARHAAYAA
jgi:hypothetical protein